MKKYKTIYADPAWSEVGGGKIKRGADRHYPVMKTKDIIKMKDMINKVSEDNSHLYLWVTNTFLKDGLKVMEEWGYRYITTITWAKDRFGLGQYFRGQTEHCLFGVKGKIPYKILNGKRQQGTTLITAKRAKHSKKPDQMYEYIEKVSYGNYLELFARNAREGWDSWGNEINNMEFANE
jgi:N6-adenosine-specific RNA methylase IME4|tara:strand:- start:961 stop:1497 length:537 start_codon:yes stop_codon:yes gene_type:complete